MHVCSDSTSPSGCCPWDSTSALRKALPWQVDGFPQTPRVFVCHRLRWCTRKAKEAPLTLLLPTRRRRVFPTDAGTDRTHRHKTEPWHKEADAGPPRRLMIDRVDIFIDGSSFIDHVYYWDHDNNGSVVFDKDRNSFYQEGSDMIWYDIMIWYNESQREVFLMTLSWDLIFRCKFVFRSLAGSLSPTLCVTCHCKSSDVP